MSSSPPENMQPTPENYPSSPEQPALSESPPETTIHESRLSPSLEAYKQPENHRFRKAYRKLGTSEAVLMDAIKDKANELYTLIESSAPVSPSERARCAALSKTKLEECVFWVVKGITA